MERSELTSVMELPDDAPPLLGYIPLEMVDLLPNPTEGRLEPNPRFGGKWVMDML